MLLGVHEDIPPAELVDKYPGVRMTRSFIPRVLGTADSWRAKFRNACQPSWDAGLIPMVSFKTDPTDTVSGVVDGKLEDIARWLKTKPETWVVWWHEPEGTLSGRAFSNAFTYVREAFKSSNERLKVGYAAMAYEWWLADSTGPCRDWTVEADFYGCDVYSGMVFPLTTLYPRHPGYLRWKYQQKHRGPGIHGLSERGFVGTHDHVRAVLIRQEADLVARDDLAFYLFWNGTGREKNPRLLNGPLATAALREMVSRLSPGRRRSWRLPWRSGSA